MPNHDQYALDLPLTVTSIVWKIAVVALLKEHVYNCEFQCEKLHTVKLEILKLPSTRVNFSSAMNAEDEVEILSPFLSQDVDVVSLA